MNIRKRVTIERWNICFSKAEPPDIISGAIDISCFSWMKHDYKDRAFADPFILKADSDFIEVLVEELPFMRADAYLSKLKIDANSFRLLEKKTILKNKTHFSYPQIIRYNGNIYIVPENTVSGKLDLYRYDEEAEQCCFVKTLINTPVADATIVFHNNEYWLFGNKKDNKNLYLWKSAEIFGNYEPQEGVLIKSNFKGSRMAGAFFEIAGKLYRPSQDCNTGYGAGTIIQRVDKLSLSEYRENEVEHIYPFPQSYYNKGTHTLNFYNELCVADGYTHEVNYFKGSWYWLCRNIRRFFIKSY